MLSLLLALASLASAFGGAATLCPDLEALSVGSSDCPDDLDLVPCDDLSLEAGDFCEGDGECGTSEDLDNCSDEDHQGADIYRIVSSDESESSESTESESEEESTESESEEESTESESADAGPACPTLEALSVDSSDCPDDLDLCLLYTSPSPRDRG